MKVNYFILSSLSFFLSGTGAWLICKYGHHLQLLDKPSARSSHHADTPKGGGIGILAVFIVVSVVVGMPKSFWIPATLLSIISFFGDRYPILPVIRIFFQFAAGIIFLVGFWNKIHDLAAGHLMIIPLSIFIVATANYYNFMDGIDGIAGITGVVGFGLLAFFAYFRGENPFLMVLSISLSFSCLGFLPFNLPKAKVFMGDVGSILLGFTFVTMVIMLADSLLELICLSLFLFPFYADEITTELIRLKDGEKLWTPHRRHLYQILANEYCIAHWKVSLGYGLVQLFIGASILYFLKLGLLTVLSIFFLYFAVFSVISFTLRKRLIQKTGI